MSRLSPGGVLTLVFLAATAQAAKLEYPGFTCRHPTWKWSNSSCWTVLNTIPPVSRLPNAGDSAEVLVGSPFTVDVSTPTLFSLTFGSMNRTLGGTFLLTQSGSAVHTTVESVTEFVTFVQTAGSNEASHFLDVEGTYNLQGASSTLSASTESVDQVFFGRPFGLSPGVFNQSGGMNKVDQLIVGSIAAGNHITLPKYNLTGGQLSASTELIGDQTDGFFTQNAGKNQLTHDLTLGGNTSKISGIYQLNGGQLIVGGNLIVGTSSGGVGGLGQRGASAVTVFGSVNINSSDSVYGILGGALTVTKGINIDDGKFQLSGGAVTGDVNVNTSGTLLVKGSGTIKVAGDLIQNGGHVQIAASTGTLKVVFDNETLEAGTLSQDPATNQTHNLTVGAGGIIRTVAGDVFDITGNFQNLSTQKTLWNTTAAQLDFTGGGTHSFDLAGVQGAGFNHNFAWASLVIDAGNTIDLGMGSGNALYVSSLQGLLFSGTTITNLDGAPGLIVYYNSADNPLLHGNYNLTGGGELIASGGIVSTPEPSTLLLFVGGLGSLIACGRRRGLHTTRFDA